MFPPTSLSGDVIRTLNNFGTRRWLPGAVVLVVDVFTTLQGTLGHLSYIPFGGFLAVSHRHSTTTWQESNKRKCGIFLFSFPAILSDCLTV